MIERLRICSQRDGLRKFRNYNLKRLYASGFIKKRRKKHAIIKDPDQMIAEENHCN